MGRVLFLSHVLEDQTPLYGGKKDLSFQRARAMAQGDTCNTMRWSLGNHAGTHVDAPRHFIDKGKAIDRFSAGDWVFEHVAFVSLKRVRPGHIIRPEDMGRIARDTDLLLIKTGFERCRARDVYWKNSPGLHPDMAGWLKEKCPRIRAVGMDIISVSSLGNRDLGRQAHHEFLRRGMPLVEDMKLALLKTAPARVVVAPLRVKDSDASPCLVLAWSCV